MKSLILFSGGLDSTVLLAHRLAVGDEVTAIGFDYGQRHRKELKAAQWIAEYYGVPYRVIGMASVALPSALTGTVEVPDGHAESPDSTTVPCRNLIFLSIAAAVAESGGVDAVFIGANADDNAGYLDCRPMFLNAMHSAIKLATSRNIELKTPYLHMTKAQIVNKGLTLHAPIWMSWSCYRGEEEPCGRCGACESRKDAGA